MRPVIFFIEETQLDKLRYLSTTCSGTVSSLVREGIQLLKDHYEEHGTIESCSGIGGNQK